MSNVKKFICILLMMLSPTIYAVDEWQFSEYGKGDIVYTSGFYRTLILGGSGVGLATVGLNYDAPFHSSPIQISIDGSTPINYEISILEIGAILLKDSKDLRQKIEKAKIVSIKYATCRKSPCLISSNGESQSVTWEFDKTLEELKKTGALQER
jgi:hypothetical protein